MSKWPSNRLLLLLAILLLTSCQTLHGEQAPKVSITMDELRALAEKGGSLSWNDFKAYPYEDEGSGLYIRKYDVEGGNQLIISGKSLDKKPDHIYVVNKDGEKIDLLKENSKDLNF
ncbi:hypothetical protein [Paenibacillus pabuli]|uniref:hypothetical protein n=1 Tax=Paenibacillus pabuli TaxID=1472 RepID=UPI003CE9EC7E